MLVLGHYRFFDVHSFLFEPQRRWIPKRLTKVRVMRQSQRVQEGGREKEKLREKEGARARAREGKGQSQTRKVQGSS